MDNFIIVSLLLASASMFLCSDGMYVFKLGWGTKDFRVRQANLINLNG